VRFKIVPFITLSLIFVLLLAGCGGRASDATPTPVPTDTPTPLPTLTPTPEIPLAILVIPADMDQTLSNLYQKTVYDLTQQAGYRFQVRNSLTTADLEPALRVAIIFPPDPGVADLAAAAPQAQFLAVNIPNLNAGGNISVLANTNRPDVTAFLAGYVGAMTTTDYHIGMLKLKDDPDSQKVAEAFTNGKIFYCGICNPYVGPYYDFPIIQDVPVDAPTTDYGGYVNVLTQYNVEMVYIDPKLATTDMLNAVSSSGVSFISPVAPQSALPGLMMSVQPDIIKAIQIAWPDLIAGNGGQMVQSPPELASIDPNLISPGKQRLAEDVLQGLLDGSISTGVSN
jgi:hypothetical protein